MRRRWQFDAAIRLVQPPSECFLSGASDSFVAVSATSGGRMATLTGGFDF